MSGKRQRGKMRARDHPLFGPYSGRGQISFPSDLLRQILALSSPEEQEQESEEDEKDEGLTRLKNASTRANKVDDFDKNIEPHIEDLSADEQVGNDRTDRKREEIKSRQSYRRQCSISTKKSQTSKSTEFQATIISKRKRESPVARRHTKVLSKWKPRLTEREKCPKKKKKAFETSTATTGTKKIFQGNYGLHVSGEFIHKKMLCSVHFEKVRGDTLNSKPVWRSLENCNLWLWMTSNGSWMIGSTKNKLSGLERGFLVSSGPGRNPTCVKTWKVWSGKAWHVDATARVTGYKFREWTQRIKDMNASVQTKARSQAVALRVSGAQEELSMLINGYYVLQTDLYNFRPLYRKYPAEDIWVRFGPDGDWTISAGTDKEENTSGSLCYSQGRPTILPFENTLWKVDDGNKSSAFQPIKMKPFKPAAWTKKKAEIEKYISERTEQAMKCAPTQVHVVGDRMDMAKAICISGAEGPKAADINGHYKLASDVPFNGRPLYQKVEAPDIWLRIAPDGDWGVTYTESKDANDGTAICYCSGEPRLLPAAAMLLPCSHKTKWMVMGEDLDYTHQPSVSVVGLTVKEWTDAQALRDEFVLKQAKETAVTIRIMGAEGVNAGGINGYYRLQEGIYNGRPLYQKAKDKDAWLWMARDGDWTIGRFVSRVRQNHNSTTTACKYAENSRVVTPCATPTTIASTQTMVTNGLDSICYSVGAPGLNPSQAEGWRVDNGNEWTDSNVKGVAYPVFRALR